MTARAASAGDAVLGAQSSASIGAGNVDAIEAPPDAAFSCHRCNKCCRGSWIIGITENEAAALRVLYPTMEPVGGEAGERDGQRFFRMARRADQSCIFLDEDGCRIHREHGEGAKPAICRRFPFSLTSFGATSYLHLSRVCPSVYAERGDRGRALLRSAVRSHAAGDTVEPRAAEPRAFEPRAADPAASVPATVTLAGTCRISFADYLVLEKQIDLFLRDDRWPLDDVMAAIVVLIRRWTEDPAAAVRRAVAMREAVLAGDAVGHHGGGDAVDEGVELVMEAIARRNPLVGLHRYVLATLVTVIESRRQGRAWSRESLADMGRYLRVLLARGEERLAAQVRESGPAVVDLARIGHVPWPRRQVPSLQPVRSLLASHVHRKILLTSGPDIEFSWHLLLVAYAVLKFYARAAAVADGRDQLIPSDLEEGVRVVEYHLLLHPQHLPPLQQKFLGGWFRRFLFHPQFPSSMTCL